MLLFWDKCIWPNNFRSIQIQIYINITIAGKKAELDSPCILSTLLYQALRLIKDTRKSAYNSDFNPLSQCKLISKGSLNSPWIQFEKASLFHFQIRTSLAKNLGIYSWLAKREREREREREEKERGREMAFSFLLSTPVLLSLGDFPQQKVFFWLG